jgi:ribosomal protein L29
MKRKEILAMHAKTEEELKVQVHELENEIAKLKKELSEKKLKNTNLIRGKKDDLARVETELAHRIKK